VRNFVGETERRISAFVPCAIRLMKLPLGVIFSNFLWAAKVILAVFLHLKFGFEFFRWKKFGEKLLLKSW
jgi:hypothetical protein